MRIVVDDVKQGYGDTEVLHGVSFTIETGKILSLLGPNGSGKSTLIKTIAGISRPKSGSVQLDNKDIFEIEPSKRAKVISYVPQAYSYMPYTSVLETVLIGRTPHMGWNPSEEDLKIVEHALKNMQIEDLVEKNVNELSGGQRQRVFIARSLAQCPSFYLFDEPTSSLDLKYQLETMDIMKQMVYKDNIGVIIAIHDLNLAMNFSDNVIALKNGKIRLEGTAKDTITENFVSEIYGVNASIIKNENGQFILPYESIDKSTYSKYQSNDKNSITSSEDVVKIND
ncbi:MAG: ABC transporter ATP-binding protein [Parabacteroides sp.]